MPRNVIYVDGYAAPIALPPPPPAPEPPPPPPAPEPPPPPPAVPPEPPNDALLPPGRTGPPPPGVVYIPAPPAMPPPPPPVVPFAPEPPNDALVPSQGPRLSIAPPGTVYYPAPPAEPVQGAGAGGESDTETDTEGGARGPSLWDYGDPLDEARFLAATNPPLEGQAFIAAMRHYCDLDQIDPLGAAVNVLHEGWRGTIGDGGLAYGPWQDHMTEFKGRPWYTPDVNRQRNREDVNAWAWTRDGIAYAVRSMSRTAAKGVTGPRSAWLIAYWYEKPQLRLAEANAREDLYRSLVGQTGLWDYLAGQMKGASGTPGAQTTPATPGVPPVGNLDSWRAFLETIRTELPATATHLANVARRLRGDVK